MIGRVVVLAPALLAWSCTSVTANDGDSNGAGEVNEVDLVQVDGFYELDVEEDPFADHRPEHAACQKGSVVVEDGYLEIDTGECGWVTLAQPIAYDVSPDDVVHLLTWHNELWAEEEAEAHVVVAIDDEILLEAWPTIPSAAAVFDVELAVGFSAPQGSLALWHVHNHGVNNYRLAYLTVLRNP